ncbi:MAG: sigma-70 family RNA polymerase sigma factor [Planctomycetota bacterium]
MSVDPRDPAAERAEALVDHALVRRAQAGDHDAFGELVQRHQRRAFRVARNLVPTDADAQDLAQEAFLRVYRSLDRFDFAHEFTTWLYRIVTNLCIDFLRKRRSTFSVSGGGEDEAPIELADPDQAAPSERAEAEETAAEVEAVLEALAPHFRTVLTLREIEGLSCPEIAEIVGATHVTVRWRLHRGRKLFQEEWERRSRLRSQGGTELLGEGLMGDAAMGGPAADGSAPSRSAPSRSAPTPADGARTSNSRSGGGTDAPLG